MSEFEMDYPEFSPEVSQGNNKKPYKKLDKKKSISDKRRGRRDKRSYE